MKRFLIPAAMLLAVTQAHAASFVVERNGCDGKNCHIIRIDGQILPEDSKTFEAVVRVGNINNAVVYLSSAGGNMMAGVRIGLKIKALGFATYVSDGKY